MYVIRIKWSWNNVAVAKWSCNSVMEMCLVDAGQVVKHFSQVNLVRHLRVQVLTAKTTLIIQDTHVVTNV